MTREEILFKVKKAIDEVICIVDLNEVDMETHFVDDLGLDSVDSMSLILALEDEFGVALPPDRAKEIKTVEEAVSIIEETLLTSDEAS